MTTDLVRVIDNSKVAALAEKKDTFLMLGPQAMVNRASEIATVLKDVIDKQGLFSIISGKKYVKHEGWSTLGTILGILPREQEVVELQDGSYQAKVELYNLHTDQIVGQASAICGMDEKRWKGADKYARRSMAVTRATGKAYRLGFGWIMALAGYEATPSEEVPDEQPKQQQQTQQQQVHQQLPTRLFDRHDPMMMSVLKAELKAKGGEGIADPEWFAKALHGTELKRIKEGELDRLIVEFMATLPKTEEAANGNGSAAVEIPF